MSEGGFADGEERVAGACRPPGGGTFLTACLHGRVVVFYKYEYECEVCRHRWLSTHMVLEPASCPKCGNKDAEKVSWRELAAHEKRHAPTTEKGKRGRL